MSPGRIIIIEVFPDIDHEIPFLNWKEYITLNIFYQSVKEASRIVIGNGLAPLPAAGQMNRSLKMLTKIFCS
jgi:hypothetical protein